MQKFAIFWGLVFFHSVVFAKVFVDPSLSQQLTRVQDMSSQQVHVLVLFQKSSRIEVSEARQQLNQHIENLQNQLVNRANRSLNALWIVHGVSLNIGLKELEQLKKMGDVQGIYWADKKEKIDAPIRGSLERSLRFTYGLSKVGVAHFRKDYREIQGQGVRVGVLDTGINARHRDLKGRTLLYKNFSPDKNSEPSDEFNHGTHVAGTIAGGNESGEFIGAAPAADLIIGRIFDRSGESSKVKILQAMQWMADPDNNPETEDFAQVVNSSWGNSSSYADRDPKDEPYCVAVETWRKMGIIPVFSAGNTGPGKATVNFPGACPQALSVGATEHNDRLMYFSGVGPANWKSITVKKPDVVAPGFRIKSASSSGGYTQLSGTSMATPHVTGALALLLQLFPEHSSEQLIEALLQGVKDLGTEGHDNDFGWGRVDLQKSVELLQGEL